MVFMNDFLSIYRVQYEYIDIFVCGNDVNDFLSIYRVQYEYIDIFVCGNDGVSAYKFRILYSMIP